jgi:hypothetical protein
MKAAYYKGAHPFAEAERPKAMQRGVEAILANHRSHSITSPAEPVSVSPADEVGCNKWELFMLLSFVVLSFAGLLFCGYVILAKCRGTWPF